jgi:hypothetical protein
MYLGIYYKIKSIEILQCENTFADIVTQFMLLSHH